MHNLKKIPMGCIGNMGVISCLKGTDEFNKACIAAPKLLGFENSEQNEWPFFNPSWGAYLLYCLIVVPKELYELDPEGDFYKELKRKNVMRHFEIHAESNSFSDKPDYHFRSMRNSVSHVNYSLDNSDLFEMWDHKPGQPNNRHWHVSIKHDDMQKFFVELAECLVPYFK
ncbi:HEPN family nuclease [Vibrio vulnificus]|nr:hypothetical protein [Vibrio vulnificus]EHZ2756430.1 hypothetical protein [Vibrio vulnificus]EHZ2765523.1 hypothetical protein [Vibrio vulnificus]EKD8805313.1 hypothetical protein [Vibrio vulnificus]EME0912070.1 hypothetical protein [Vibrio vulnificus]